MNMKVEVKDREIFASGKLESDGIDTLSRALNDPANLTTHNGALVVRLNTLHLRRITSIGLCNLLKAIVTKKAPAIRHSHMGFEFFIELGLVQLLRPIDTVARIRLPMISDHGQKDMDFDVEKEIPLLTDYTAFTLAIEHAGQTWEYDGDPASAFAPLAVLRASKEKGSK